jgi:hypothetical protein
VVFFSLSRQTKIINLLSLVHFSIVVGVTLAYRNTGPEKVGVTYTDTVYNNCRDDNLREFVACKGSTYTSFKKSEQAAYVKVS